MIKEKQDILIILGIVSLIITFFQKNNVPFHPLVLFLIVYILLGGVFFSLFYLVFTRRFIKDKETEQTKLKKINSLSLTKAEKLANKLMIKYNHKLFTYKTEKALRFPHENKLGLALKQFLSKYGNISYIKSGININWRDVEPLKVDRSYLLIGSIFEHTYICSKAGSDNIFIYEEDVPLNETLKEKYSTIYHFLVSYLSDYEK